MKFGLFYEHQLPRPWDDGDVLRLFQDSLDQVELADKLGFDHVWAVEHHFLEEYSLSSAPEVFLAACAQRSKNIRLGHGIVLMPPAYNAPARVAERIATLDLISGGRVDFGTGESASNLEMGGFDVPPDQKGAMWREALEQTANMLVMDPYPGFEGEFFSMPCRNVVPKPVQKPHPPLWMACSQHETMLSAARLGLGALTFAFLDPAEARRWVGDYYRTLKEECIPIGHAINPNVAMVAGFSCHQDEDEARKRGADGVHFFFYALGHHYLFGKHKPGRTDIWKNYQRDRDKMPDMIGRAIGTPARVGKNLREFAEAGVDQVIFIQQAGRTRHEHICEALELFAAEVMPSFKDEVAERQRKKMSDLEPYLEKAMARKKVMAPLAEADIPIVRAPGRRVGPEMRARNGKKT